MYKYLRVFIFLLFILIATTSPKFSEISNVAGYKQTVQTISPHNSNQLVNVARLGRGNTSDIAWIPSSGSFVLATQSGIYFYDSAMPEKSRTIIPRFESGIRSVEFSPGGKFILTGSGHDSITHDTSDNVVRVWDFETKELLFTTPNHETPITHIDFDHTGSIFAIGSIYGYDFDAVTLWSIDGFNNVARFENRSAPIAFSPSEPLLAVRYNESIEIWNYDSNSIKLSLPHDTEIIDVGFSYDGEVVASLDYSEHIYIWNPENGEKITTFSGKESFAFHPSRPLLVYMGLDDNIYIYDYKQGKINSNTENPGFRPQLEFSPDGNSIMLTYLEGEVFKWNFETDTVLPILSGQNYPIVNVAFNDNNTEIVTASRNPFAPQARIDGSNIRIWDLSDYSESIVVQSDQMYSGDVAFSSNGVNVVGINRDFSTIWNINENSIILDDYDFSEVPQLGNNGEDFAVVMSTDTIHVFSINDGSEIYKSNHIFPKITTFDFNSQNKIIATAHERGEINILDIKTDEILKTLQFSEDTITSISLNPQFNMIAVGNNTIEIWDYSKAENSIKIDRNRGYITSLALSPDGSVLAVTDDNGVLELWNSQTGEQLFTTQAHGKEVVTNIATFSPDGTWLALGSNDRTISLWRISTEHE